MKTVAWMGGSRPRRLLEIGERERQVVSYLFQQQCVTYSQYWGDLPKNIAKVFWTRARYDAHATVRT